MNFLISENELSKYLEPTELIQSNNPEIKALANELTRETQSIKDAAEIINNWVYLNLRKRFTPDISNAVQTLNSLEGDCGEHSALTVALLRASEIPAREVAGLVYIEDLQGFGFHAWVEFYAGRWIQMDPTSNQNSIDASHIMLVRGDLLEMTIPIIKAASTIKIDIVDYK